MKLGRYGDSFAERCSSRDVDVVEAIAVMRGMRLTRECGIHSLKVESNA